MDPNAAKLLYLCWKGGPHPAHEHFVTANADVVAVRPFNMEMVKYLAGRKYDVAVADGFGTLPIGWALKKIGLISNLIFVTTSHAFVDHRQIFKLMLKDVDGVIATSSLMRSLVKDLIGYKGPIVICFPIPNITDFLEINPSINSMKACFIGTPKFHKGVDLLPKIAHMLYEKTKMSKVYVIGHVQHYESNQRREIEFFGHVTRKKLLKIVSECSVYVHPARIEAFGASVAEAMAAGLIPVVTRKTGAKDLVELLNPDLVVREDVDAISRKIIEVWSWKPEKRAKLSNEAKNVIQDLANEKRNSFISSLKAILNKRAELQVD